MSTSFDTSPLRLFKTRSNEIFSDHPALKSLVAGSVSGSCATLLFQPLDLVKTRIQTGQSLGSRRMLPIFVGVVKSDNVIGLWRGTLPSLMRTVPGVGLYFASLNFIQTNMHPRSDHSKPSALEAVTSGIAARSFAGAVLLPVTVLKTRYESGLFHYKSLSDALRMTYTTEGVRGLFSGITPTLLRDAPFSGLYFMFYTQLKEYAAPQGSSAKPFSIFACGLTAGLLASFVTHPFDVVKTKMQLERAAYRNFLSAILIIHRRKGFNGFFAGLAPRMLRRSLMSALTWTVFESLMKNVGLK